MTELSEERKVNRKRGVGVLNGEALRSDRASQRGNWGAVASALGERVMLNLET